METGAHSIVVMTRIASLVRSSYSTYFARLGNPPRQVNQSALRLSGMQMKLFRKLLVGWMMVWLPFAGAMAAVMPLSGSVVAVSASNSTSGAEEGLSFMPCHGKRQSVPLAFGQGCSHCVLCNLAGALAMQEMPVIAASVPAHIFAAAPVAIHSSFIPELTAPPPRASLA